MLYNRLESENSLEYLVYADDSNARHGPTPGNLAMGQEMNREDAKHAKQTKTKELLASLAP